MEKQDYIYIALIAALTVFVLMWNYGTLSSNVKQENLQESILRFVNQSYILEHEDEAREKQTAEQQAYDNDARENQTKTFRSQFREDLNMLRQNLTEFMIRENNTTNKLFSEIDNNTAENSQILNGLENNTRQHEKVARDHDGIQNEVINKTDKLLEIMNSHHQHIEEVHKLLLDLSNNNNSNSNLPP